MSDLSNLKALQGMHEGLLGIDREITPSKNRRSKMNFRHASDLIAVIFFRERNRKLNRYL